MHRLRTSGLPFLTIAAVLFGLGSGALIGRLSRGEQACLSVSRDSAGGTDRAGVESTPENVLLTGLCGHSAQPQDRGPLMLLETVSSWRSSGAEVVVAQGNDMELVVQYLDCGT